MGSTHPLDRIRVVTMGQVVSGPICSAFLADLGADVIKIEPPQGDSIRSGRRELNGYPFSSLYELYNRGKRSVALDIKSAEGQELLADIVADTDVFVHNFGPGVAERLGVNYDSLRTVSEGLVYVSISGYGESGPKTDQPAFDTLIQHAAGLATMQAYEDDPPVAAGTYVADYFAGYNAAVSALAALYERAVGGGGGQKIEISMFESLLHNMRGVFELYNNLGETPEGRKRGVNRDIIFGAEETADGYVAVACLVTFPNIWKGFCKLLGREELLEHPDYQTPADRDEHRDELTALLREWLRERSATEAVEELNEVGIPAEHANDITDVPDMDLVEAREAFVSFDHPMFGSIELTQTPLDMSGSPVEIQDRSPLKGEHNEDVLREVGYSDEEIQALATEGILSSDAD